MELSLARVGGVEKLGENHGSERKPDECDTRRRTTAPQHERPSKSHLDEQRNDDRDEEHPDQDQARESQDPAGHPAMIPKLASERSGPEVTWPLRAHVAWGLGLLASLPAIALAGPAGASLADRLARNLEIPNAGIAFLVGGLAGATLGGGAIQALGLAIALRIAGRSSPWSWRQELGRSAAYVWHGFPLTTPFFLAIPAATRLLNDLSLRRAALRSSLVALYVLAVALYWAMLTGWAPFLRDHDRIVLLGGGAVLYIALRTDRDRRISLHLASAAVGAYLFCYCPQDPGPWTRLILALLASSLCSTPALIASQRDLRGFSAAGLTLCVGSIALWMWWIAFLGLPSPRQEARVTDQPGVELHHRNGTTTPWSDNRFLVRPCSGSDLLYGSREVSAGVSLIEAGSGHPRSSLAVSAGYNLAANCTEARGYVGSYDGNGIAEITLTAPLSLRLLRDVQIDSPTLIELSPGGTALLALDDKSGAVHWIDLPSERVTRSYQAFGIPNGFALDDAANLIHIATSGHLLTFDTRSGQVVRKLDLRRGLIRPFPLKPHFHRVVLDPETGATYVTYLEFGRVYRIDGRRGILMLEADIGRGVRDLTWDTSRGTLYVGNYITGDVLGLDAQSLEVMGRVFIGSRIRGLAVDDQRLLATSAVGGISVEIEHLVGPSPARHQKLP